MTKAANEAATMTGGRTTDPELTPGTARTPGTAATETVVAREIVVAAAPPTS